MTLVEYIDQLPRDHRAYQEYIALRAEIERKDKALEMLWQIIDDIDDDLAKKNELHTRLFLEGR
jgi:hypothetical protein